MSSENPVGGERPEENASCPTLSAEASAATRTKTLHSPTAGSRRAQISLVMGAAILVVGAIAANWPYQYASFGRVTLGQMNSPVDFDAQPTASPIMGGWPFKYLIRYPRPADGQPSTVRFSALALLYDIAIAGFVSGCLFMYLYRRSQSGQSSASRVSIADLLVLTLILAVPLGWWQRVNARHTRQAELALAVSNAGGSCSLSVSVPKLIGDFLPQPMARKLRDVREVRVEYPDKELMNRLVDHRELEILRVGGGDYELSVLERLTANPHLVDLRIAGRVLDSRTMQAIVAHQGLHTLNLIRTNISAESLQLLDQLPELQRLNLIHSDVSLSDLGTPGWSRTIRELWLPHPGPGEMSSLRIAGWPQLEILVINEFESQLNSTPMKVELSDLPLLRRLQLDVFQKFDLQLHDLPSLAAIDQLDFQWRSRLPSGGKAPGHLWCGRLDVDGLPAMKELSFFCLGLEHLRIRNTPRLEIAGIAAFFRTQSAATYATELKPEAAAALITGLGESDGPDVIDLDAVPMKGVDLGPLSNNRGITTIKLSQSGSDIHQWMALEPMKWLKRLDVKDCPIDDAAFQWILEAFPKLEHLTCSPPTTSFFGTGSDVLESLEIVNRPNLRTLDLGESGAEYISKVRIVDAPNLTLSLRLGDLQSLEINHAPSIRGLSVAGPVPEGAMLSGVRDLEFVAVGGAAVTDNFIAPLAACKSLTTLTLAYPDVSPDALRNLDVSGIESLNLPGTPLNDSVVADWPEFSTVRNLDLRDTQITGSSVDRILVARAATRLILDRTPVKASELGFLVELADLSELSLAGVGIQASTLSGLLAHGTLTQLDLSECDITSAVLDAIASHPGSLQILVLRHCNLNHDKLAAIAAQHPGIRFDLSGSNPPTQWMTSLLAADRIIDRDELEQQIALQKIMNLASQGSFQEIELEFPAMIDVRRFQRQPRDPAVATGQRAAGGGWTISALTTSGEDRHESALGTLGNRIGQWLGGVLGARMGQAGADQEPVEMEELVVDAEEPSDE